MACAAQSASLMEVEIFNPTKEELTFDVQIEGDGLRGDPTVTLKAAQKKYFQLVFAPAIIGKTTGRYASVVIFSVISVLITVPKAD